MIYTVNKPLYDFDFWGVAKQNASLLTYSQFEQVDDLLQDIYAGQQIDDTFINDLFWFDFDFVATLLGFKDGDALERAARESDE